jgi:hypothetical protein
MIQPTLFDDGAPPAQRHSATSTRAAGKIEPQADTLRRVVLEAIAESGGGLTDEEGIATTGIQPNTYRPRRVELSRMGWIRDSGRTRQTQSGRDAVVWEVEGATCHN